MNRPKSLPLADKTVAMIHRGILRFEDHGSMCFQAMAYPCQTVDMIQARIDEVKKLGIQGIVHQGKSRIRGYPVLGKGYCGVVVLAQWLNTKQNLMTVALKSRRIDAPKKSFEQEAKGLAIANRLGIGPILYAHSPNFIVMEYLNGGTIAEWLQKNAAKDSLNRVIRDLLEQCFQLDQAGLDHGNLRCITEHVIMQNEQPVLIDFSSSSCDRRPANVTTLTQGLFWGTVVPSLISQHCCLPVRDAIIPVLREYKYTASEQSFQALLNALQLTLCSCS